MLRGLAGAHDVAPKSTAYQTIDLRSAAAEDCATQGRHLEPEQSAAAGADGFWRLLDRQSGSAAHAARPLSWSR
jgi:hypothetical protein